MSLLLITRKKEQKDHYCCVKKTQAGKYTFNVFFQLYKKNTKKPVTLLAG